MKKPILNGLIFEPPQKQDWVLGGSPYKRDVLFPEGDCEKYLPTPERQASRVYDPFSCVANSCHNCLETILCYMMEKDPDVEIILKSLEILDENGKPNLSDRFLAKVSGTIPGRGNSLRAVAEAVRKFGFVSEKFWPKTDNMDEATYYAEIPDAVMKQAAKSLVYFEIHHENLMLENDGVFYSSHEEMAKARKLSPLQVCVDGNYWNVDGLFGSENGGVGRTINYTHATCNFKADPGTTIESIFDTYDPFKKKFVPDYPFGTPKLFFITKKKIMMPQLFKKNGEAAIYALDPLNKQLVPFSDGLVPGGEVFKTIYGTSDYEAIPRQNVDVLPYPVASYSITTK